MAFLKKSLGVLVVLAALAGCADDEPPVEPARTSRHVSPDAIPAATVPPGTFDQTQAASELESARQARIGGRLAEARRLVETSLARWPGSIEAWSELQTICQALPDADCVRYAAFFHDKVEFASSLQPRVAMLGFQNISRSEAQAPAKNSKQSSGYDRPTIAMALRLEAFYNLLDPDVVRRNAPVQDQSYLERHPSAPLLGAAAAGVLGGAGYLIAR